MPRKKPLLEGIPHRIHASGFFRLGPKSVGWLEWRRSTQKTYHGGMFVRAVDRFKINGVVHYACYQCDSDGEVSPKAENNSWFNVSEHQVKFHRRARRKARMGSMVRADTMFRAD